MLTLNIQGKTLKEVHNSIREMAMELEDETHVELPDDVVAVNVSPVTEAIEKLPEDLAGQAAIGQATLGPQPPEVEKLQAEIIDRHARHVTNPPHKETQPNLDVNGLPWDKRIHSANKTKNEDGSWRNKRGVDKAYLAQVTDMLVGSVVTPAAVIPKAPAPTVEVPKPATPLRSAPQEAQPVEQPSYANVDIPVENKPAHSVETFISNLPMVLTELVNANKLTQEYLSHLCEHFGVSAVWEIANDKTKASSLFEHLVDNGLVTKVG